MQHNISVIGLFTLAGRNKKIDDVFVNHECLSTRWIHSVKTNTNKLNHKHSSRAFYYVFFYMPFLYVLSSFFFFLNSIEQPVFKAPIFPTYSTNIVIVIFNKWPLLLSDLGHPFAAHGLPFLLFLPVFTSGHP